LVVNEGNQVEDEEAGICLVFMNEVTVMIGINDDGNDGNWKRKSLCGFSLVIHCLSINEVSVRGSRKVFDSHI
jgi:hypothetical protein